MNITILILSVTLLVIMVPAGSIGNWKRMSPASVFEASVEGGTVSIIDHSRSKRIEVDETEVPQCSVESVNFCSRPLLAIVSLAPRMLSCRGLRPV